MRHVIKQYLKKNSWRLNENANTSYSYSGLLAYISNRELANYALSKMPSHVSKAHMRGDIHVHNLESGQLIPYCHGGDLRKLLLKGINSKSIISKPAKHLSAAVDHIVNYFFMSQLEFSGAQAFSDFDTLLSPFVAYDNLSYNEVKQAVQRLIFNLNFACRQAYQTPFTNLTFNLGCPRSLAEKSALIGGKPEQDTYEDFVEEAQTIAKAFCEILMSRDAHGNPFTFPIPTLNISTCFPWKSEVANMIFAEISVLGSYYFMNYLGSGIDDSTVRAMCCRLNIDLTQLTSARGLWNFSGGTGSIGVVSLNMSRLGYLSKNEDDLFNRLEILLNIAKDQLEYKRKNILKSYNNGLMPFTKYYELNLDNYFSTIGIIGLNEMCINFLGKPLHQASGFIMKVLQYIRNIIKEIQKETKHLYNLEMTPGEGSSYRLAYIDRKKYKKIKTLGTKNKPYYTTLLIPPKYDLDLEKRIEIEERLLPVFTGGTVFRIYAGNFNLQLPLANDIKKLVYKISKTKIPYFDITSTFSVCPKDGKFIRDIVNKCPECNSNMEIYSRVVGYYRPKQRWNIGKQQEFKDRKYINIGIWMN